PSTTTSTATHRSIPPSRRTAASSPLPTTTSAPDGRRSPLAARYGARRAISANSEGAAGVDMAATVADPTRARPAGRHRTGGRRSVGARVARGGGRRRRRSPAATASGRPGRRGARQRVAGRGGVGVVGAGAVTALALGLVHRDV